MLQFFYFGQPEAALEALPHLEAYLNGVLGIYYIPLFHFYKSLVLLANAERTGRIRKFSYLAGADRCIRAMKRYARTAPANNLHKLYLMQAERERVRGRFLSAADYYDRANWRAATGFYRKRRWPMNWPPNYICPQASWMLLQNI